MKFKSAFLIAAVLIAFVAGLIAIGNHFGALAAVGTYLVVDSFGRLATTSRTLGVHTAISNLWNPAVWIPGITERLTTRRSLLNSGILITAPEIQEKASGEGTEVNIPFIKEGHIDDEPQAENTDVTISALASGKQKAAILNRRWGIGATALSRAVVGKGADPLLIAFDIIADNRLRNRQKTLLAALRGVFGNAAAPGAGSAAFKALRRDIFLEAGASPAATQLFSSDEAIKALSLLGEAKDSLDDSIIVCHSAIEQNMLLSDDITTVRDSEGKKRIRTYKDSPVFVSDLLVRSGGTSGFVYDTYIFRPGCVATGEKPQTSEIGDVASLIRIEDGTKNNVGFADYTRFIMHPQGATWGGTPAGQSATNAELATEASWTLAYGDVKNVGIVCLRTNG